MAGCQCSQDHEHVCLDISHGQYNCTICDDMLQITHHALKHLEQVCDVRVCLVGLETHHATPHQMNVVFVCKDIQQLHHMGIMQLAQELDFPQCRHVDALKVKKLNKHELDDDTARLMHLCNLPLWLYLGAPA